MLSTRADELADGTKPRCTDRRSQPALFIYTIRGQLDAWTKQASPRMGIRLARPPSPPFSWKMGGKRRGDGWPASNQPTLIPQAIRHADRLQPARRGRVCPTRVSTREDICSA